MTQGDQSRCPRCGQPIKLRVKAGTIKPHRDSLVDASCPTEGMTPREARQWVEDTRAAVKAMAR